MTLPRSVGEVLADHVTLEVECIDRMYLNVYVPKLQYATGVVGFFREHRGFQYASNGVMAPMRDAFLGQVHAFVDRHEVPYMQFRPGERKDDVMHEHLGRFDRDEGVLFVGRAQEKTSVLTTTKRRNPKTKKSYAWLVRSTKLVNHFYFYLVDSDFGPFFLKICSYFPFTAKLCINGNEWAKRQAAKDGLAFEALDNGFAACDDPEELQTICSQLGAAQIQALLRKWLRRLPDPFTDTDRAAGYRYQLSILQAEFSLTQMLDRPLTGRILFEQIIRDNLDIGRPDRIGLVFDRRVVTRGPRRTPGRFRTRVITDGVVPSIHMAYKSSKVKQYHKEARAIRTETTINNTRDFDIGKGLENMAALKRIGFSANRRLLHVERISSDPNLGESMFHQVNSPAIVNGQRAAGLRFGDPRVMALMAALLTFKFLPRGFTNRDLRHQMSHLLGIPTERLTAGRISYDLRRLRLHGLVTRVPGTNQYRPTTTGFIAALAYTRTYTRMLRPTLAELTDTGPPTTRAQLELAKLDKRIDRIAQQIAA